MQNIAQNSQRFESTVEGQLCWVIKNPTEIQSRCLNQGVLYRECILIYSTRSSVFEIDLFILKLSCINIVLFYLIYTHVMYVCVATWMYCMLVYKYVYYKCTCIIKIQVPRYIQYYILHSNA